jgi:hypothetical protein
VQKLKPSNLETVAAASAAAAAQEKQVQRAEILRNELSARECDHDEAMAQLGELQLRAQEAEKAAAAVRASVIGMGVVKKGGATTDRRHEVQGLGGGPFGGHGGGCCLEGGHSSGTGQERRRRGRGAHR